MLLPFDYGYANSRYKAWKERMKMESIFLGGGVETNYEHYIINCGKPEEENKKKDYRYLGPYQSESEGFVMIFSKLDMKQQICIKVQSIKQRHLYVLMMIQLRDLLLAYKQQA